MLVYIADVLREPGGELADWRIALPFVQDHQIDVGKRRLLSTAIAAVGHKGHALAHLAGIGLRKLPQVRVVEPRDRGIHERSVPRTIARTFQSPVVLLAQLLPALGQLAAGL